MSGTPAARITLAVVNARVWTGDPRRPWADAIVARGDRLAFVGSAAEARKLTRDAPDARVIDAAGRTLAGTPAGAVAAADGPVLRIGAPATFVLLAPGAEHAGSRIVLAVREGEVLDDPAWPNA